MSAFLGPIHFWLYGKIGNQESLTKVIADHAIGQGWITNADDYIKTLPPLETVIDEGNIHGWLQAQITDAETRYAKLIRMILAEDSGRLDGICAAAFDFGKAHISQAADAESAYRAFEDFFVNGMPCDRVNAVTEQSPETVSWEMARDIHAQYWNGDSTPYYLLRKSVMDGMLAGTALAVEMQDTAHYTIKRKE